MSSVVSPGKWDYPVLGFSFVAAIVLGRGTEEEGERES